MECGQPHRPPSPSAFRLVDRVLELTADRIVALKNVSLNEPYFAGHFPGQPLMPGVLICECLTQAAEILARQSQAPEAADRAIVLVGLDAVRFSRPVVPGEQVRLEVTLRVRRDGRWQMYGRALVDGVLAAEARLLLSERAA